MRAQDAYVDAKTWVLHSDVDVVEWEQTVLTRGTKRILSSGTKRFLQMGLGRDGNGIHYHPCIEDTRMGGTPSYQREGVMLKNKLLTGDLGF
jgi:hypothetical protein